MYNVSVSPLHTQIPRRLDVRPESERSADLKPIESFPHTHMTTPIAPKRDFVVMVAKMGHPIMDIPDEKLRRLVAMTFITEFGEDDSVTYDSVKNDIMGTMTTNLKDMQKQMAEAIAARQTKTSAELYAALRPLIVGEATKIADGDRPLSFRILFDYRTAKKNPADGSPILDSDGNPVYEADFDLKLFWKESEKAKGGTEGRASSGSGRVAGDYLFPDSLADDGSLKHWGSMAAYAADKHGYDKKNPEHKNPRFFLTEFKKLWTIPTTPTNGEYVATAYVEPAAN